MLITVDVLFVVVVVIALVVFTTHPLCSEIATVTIPMQCLASSTHCCITGHSDYYPRLCYRLSPTTLSSFYLVVY